MRVKSVRLRKLVSGPGFNHYACEMEAEIDPGEDHIEITQRLEQLIDSQLRGRAETENMRENLDALRREMRDMETERDHLTALVARGRKIIAEHDKLRNLATSPGLAPESVLLDLGEPIPF